MPKVMFHPDAIAIDVAEGTKLLVAGIKSKAHIRYGCASGKCGTCGVLIKSIHGQLSTMDPEEKALLAKMGLDIDGQIRLACRARIQDGQCDVDLDFQDSYCPDESLD